jgi:hypothetical protein
MALVYKALGLHFVKHIDIRLLEAPFDFLPSSQAIFWSPRGDRDPAHSWFRARVQCSAIAVMAASPARFSNGRAQP